ncbi:DUF222 domain-containing protein [Geodermatophilus sp. URMC 64]
MQRTAGTSRVEGFLVDWVRTRPAPEPRLPVSWLTPEEKAAELQRLQGERARLAAREADLMLVFAADRPEEDDPADDHPGARSRDWRQTEPEFPGISESCPDELGLVLGVGRGTAAHRLRRAWSWRHRLPATGAALARGALDERRAQILADTLEHIRPAPAARVEAVVLPEAAGLNFAALKRRILEVLLDLESAAADESRALAERNADVFVEPGPAGRATLGAELPAEEAAEGVDFLNALAQQAKADGDERPIGQLRAELFSLLVRGAAIGADGARASLTITAALEALEGASSRPAAVNGFAITPAHLAGLLRRVGALGLHTPEGGSLTFAITDETGRLLATVSREELERLVRRGDGLTPPAATESYTPTGAQREFIGTRDRTCRHPFCGQRAGWADHDHGVAHSRGGPTDCTNLCCLCRTHHRLKTLFRGWRFAMEPDGTLHVTTPSGITRTTRPWAMRRRPPPPPPPPDPADDPPPF